MKFRFLSYIVDEALNTELTFFNGSLGAFVASELDVVFSGYQPCTPNVADSLRRLHFLTPPRCVSHTT
jgi:hypothetical protein